jgi:hypothetical protein
MVKNAQTTNKENCRQEIRQIAHCSGYLRLNIVNKNQYLQERH